MNTNNTLADLIRDHPYSQGDATPEELAQDIADAFGPALMLDYEPTLEEVIDMKARVRYRENNKDGLKTYDTLTEDEIDLQIANQIKIWTEYVVKLTYLKKIREQETEQPSWWRRALRRRVEE